MRVVLAGVLAVGWSFLGAPVFAQPGDDSTNADPPSAVERQYERLTGDDALFQPLVDIVVPGSGLAGGARIEARSIGGSGLGAGVEGLISIRNYQHLLVRAGRLASYRDLPDFGAADEAITSVMDAGDGAVGHALFVEYRYRRLPRLSYFGRLDDVLSRTDFGLRRHSVDLVGQWAPLKSVGVSGRLGLMSTSAGAGSDDRRPDTDAIFGAALDTDRLQQTRYVTSGLGVLLQRMNDEGRGWIADATVTHFASRRDNASSFTRSAVDLRVFRQVGAERHTAAVRFLASADTASTPNRVPYYLQQTLGGSSTMRALDSYRLRGTRLVSLNLESRWRVRSFLEVVPFVDIGRVWGSSVATGLPGWRAAPGLDVRVRFNETVVGRAALARGPEGFRFVYAFDAPF